MCGMPKMPTFSISTYIQATLGAIIVALGFYCSHLDSKNEDLTTKNIVLTTSYKDKVDALTECGVVTTKLKERESKITADAKEAVEEAKKKAVIEYKAANDVLFRKPKQPKITPENVQNYGGTETEAQLKDYLSTHDLMNELIDSASKNE